MEMERENSAEQEMVQEAGMVAVRGQGMVNSEVDLSENEEVPVSDEQEPEVVDYSHYSKAQLMEVLRDLSKETNQRKIDLTLRDIRPVFDELKERDRTNALNRFILDGGAADDFEFRPDELTSEFETVYKQLKDKRAQHQRSQEEQRNENYRKKLALLEKLRELVDGQDASNQFNVFKELQKEWKNTGPVPGTHARTLWANYHALVDRFYDNQSIYFELKELDRKKNLEAKLELCSRAERLSEVEKINSAIQELNELHHEFKHLGPVPAEDKEAVWQRFKAASDAVYARRDEYVKGLQQELNANFELKNKLCDEVAVFATYQTDRIKEWNEKTKEVLDLQKRWEAIGGLPRAKSKDVNKRFWASFKSFFSNKSAFFRKLDEERGNNLKQKQDLIQRALNLKESQDWDKAAQELKQLQQEWKAIGPVPEKQRDKIFKEFKEACDYFFEQKRTHYGKQDVEQQENLKAKEAVCVELEKHIQENTATPAILKELEERYNSIGFVPKKDINTIRQRYHDAVQKFTNAIEGLTEGEKSQLIMESQLMDLKNDPMAGQKLYQKEQAIRKKIQKVENDIAVWKNNLEFFGRSKNADKYKEEFNAKIDEAAEALKQLKQQLKLLRTVS